jgi:hypothetical protein
MSRSYTNPDGSLAVGPVGYGDNGTVTVTVRVLTGVTVLTARPAFRVSVYAAVGPAP